MLLVWRGLGYGGGLPVRLYSYRENMVEHWKACDWLTKHKTPLEDKPNKQDRACLGFIRPKPGTTRFGPMTAGQNQVQCALDQ